MSAGFLITIAELGETLGISDVRAFAKRHGLDLSNVSGLGTVIHSRDLPRWTAKAIPKTPPKFEPRAIRGRQRWFG
jgi:hypothetical protein